MYEGLVKSLRWLGFMFPETHPAQDDADRMSNNIHLYCTQAADAIEELTDNNVGKWVPVTEQLPKTRESILGKKSSKVIVAFRFDDGAQGTDTAHTLNGEWVFEDHITVVARTITHWMPLPEPPKEE